MKQPRSEQETSKHGGVEDTVSLPALAQDIETESYTVESGNSNKVRDPTLSELIRHKEEQGKIKSDSKDNFI